MARRVVSAKTSPQLATRRSSKRNSATSTAPAPAVISKPADRQKSSKQDTKPKKIKMVRDSCTMPKSEYSLIAAVKKRCIAQGLVVKKSEVLRAAILGFASQHDDYIKVAIGALDVIKTGRPPKGS